MINQSSKKFLLWFVGIIVVALIVWIGGTYFNPKTQEKRALLKYFQDIEMEYKNDTYGGKTPEETLQLFITALEANDIDLASKYFLPDERGNQTAFLKGVQASDGFQRMIKEARELKPDTKDEERAFYSIVNEKNVVEVQVILKKNQNGIWKITKL